METDVSSPNMLIGCYIALGDQDAARRAAQVTLDRAQKTLSQDPSNGAAMGFCCNALAMLGQAESAKGWMSRALLIDPQTSGGLLVACSPETVDEVLSIFLRDGFEQAAVLGTLAAGEPLVEVGA
jgi:hypothetical protein